MGIGYSFKNVFSTDTPLIDKLSGIEDISEKGCSTTTDICLGGGGGPDRSTSEVYSILGATTTRVRSTVGPLDAYWFYAAVSPLMTSINKISKAGKSLPMGVKDGKDVDTGHNYIQYLYNIPFFRSKLEEWFISGMLTNECWFVCRGRVSNLPVDIDYVLPYNVSIGYQTDTDGLPKEIKTDSPIDTRRYYKSIINGIARWFDSKNSKTALNELVPFIGVKEIGAQFRGLSPLASIKKELEQIFYGNCHNSNMLEKGMKIAAMFVPKEGVTPVQYEQLQEMIREMVRDKSPVVVAPTHLDKVDLAASQTDADYIEMISEDKVSVYSLYSIPLPLVLPRSQRQSSYEAAQLELYDSAVTNWSDLPFGGLSHVLSLRDDTDDIIEIGFDPHGVKALQQRAAEKMETLSKSNKLSWDEVRGSAGYKPVPNGLGSSILVPGNLVPLEAVVSGDGF